MFSSFVIICLWWSYFVYLFCHTCQAIHKRFTSLYRPHWPPRTALMQQFIIGSLDLQTDLIGSCTSCSALCITKSTLPNILTFHPPIRTLQKCCICQSECPPLTVLRELKTNLNLEMILMSLCRVSVLVLQPFSIQTTSFSLINSLGYLVRTISVWTRWLALLPIVLLNPKTTTGTMIKSTGPQTAPLPTPPPLRSWKTARAMV